MAHSNRPLSPHLQVYKMQLTMVMSITHRITGAALCAGAVLIVVGLLALADGFDAWQQFRIFCGSWAGIAIISGFLLALVYHWLNGLRHLAWDAGYGLDIAKTYRSGKAVAVLFVLICAAILFFAFRSNT